MKHSSQSSAVRAGRRRLDLIGVGASAACLVHCLAMPLIVASLPFAADEGFEGLLVILLAAFASLSALLALARGRIAPALTCGSGLVLLALGRGYELSEGSPAERLVVVAAACLMIATHLISLAPGHGED